jgi:ureidoglycolate lyase
LAIDLGRTYLIVTPLTRDSFSPFGDVIEIQGTTKISINQGYATRFDDLCKVEAIDGGKIKISIFEAIPRPLPISIELMERHPLGSQAFYPLQMEDWLIVVCTDPHDAKSFRCFRASGNQGINYARNIWHYPLLVFKPSRFIVVDRKGPGNNLEEVAIATAPQIFVN